MARQGKGIFDSFSGNIGDIQGSKYGTLGVIKSKNKKSVKTQTPALTKTKTNFEIANEFWNLILSLGWDNVKNRPIKQQTIKNKFIGEIIKMLSINQTGTYKFNPFPPSYYTFKWKTTATLWLGQWRAVMRWGFQPYPEKSQSTDVFIRFVYVKSTNEISINGRSSGFRRNDGVRQWAQSRTLQANDKYFYGFVFISWDWSYISNGIAQIKIQP